MKTPYGRVEVTEFGYVAIRGSAHELWAWANRSGARWPCSVLANDCRNVFVEFDPRGNLVDLEHPGADDIPTNEFNAWSSDVLQAAGLNNHPAIR